ncbi:MAG: phosphoribosylglycinamide formyltransferase [Clostridia bacterium]|nr:phosphoribosylglycinamide formyltransferase [Clostridia bacterium]
MKKIAVFVSGSGSDMQSVIDSIKTGELRAEIVLVVASREGIFAIERAQKEGIECVVFDKKNYSDLNAMYDTIIEALRKAEAEYIVLAGYLNILSKNIIDAYRQKIINIHPSLIPKYCGMGYYGMRVHRAVIENKESVSGATVHYVDEGADTGEIIAQGYVEVLEDDTPETLQKRVLELEHRLLPETLKKIFN